MKNVNLKTVKDNLILFIKISFFWFLFFILVSWLDRQFGLKSLLKLISSDVYQGLAATLVTAIATRIYNKFNKWKDFLLEAQRQNQSLIDRNFDETMIVINRLQNRIDEIKISMNGFESLIEKDEKHDADINHIRGEFADLRVMFADLDQRQQQGDRLSHFADIIADCIREQERIKAKMNEQI